MGHELSNWETCSPQTADISLPAHHLSLSCSGPSRGNGQPVVIVIQGIASSTKEWPVVMSGVSDFARTYAYDRSGFDSSGTSPHPPKAEQIASELDQLLSQAKIEPPYILVCHSYGGIISREFIHHRGVDAIAGVVFVDANTEETPSTFPNPAVQAMQRGLSTLEVAIGEHHKLSPQEWEALLAAEDDPKNGEAGHQEVEYYHESGRSLAAKRQLQLQPPLLGDRPLVVLHANYALDLEKIYYAGLAQGNGTSEERQKMKVFVKQANELEETMQRKMLKMSTNSKFIHVPESGHYIHMIQPQVVIDAVRWVLSEAEKHGAASE